MFEPQPRPAGPNRCPADAGPPWLLRLLCFVVPALPFYVVLPGALKGNGAPARLIALIMFGLLVLGMLTQRRTAAQRRINPGGFVLLSYLALWLLAFGVGLTNHDDFDVASNRTRAALGLLAHVAVGLYVLARVHSRGQRDVLLGWLAVGLTFACLVGLLQGVSDLELRYLFQPPGFILNTEDLELAERMGVTRVRGTSQHAIEFSVLAAVTIPLTLYFARNAVRRRTRRFAAIGCAIAVMALPAAVSRSGIISLITALLVLMFAFKVRAVATSIVLVAAAIGAYVAVFPSIADALWRTITGSAEDDSVTSRLEDYAKVSELLHERPLFGVGLGGAPPTVFGYLDNEWMQAFVQGGLIGFTAMSLLMIGAVFGIAAALRRARSRTEREQAYTLGAMLVGIIASSATFDLFSFEQTALVLFLLFGLLWSDFGVAFAAPAPSAQRWRRLVSSRSQRARV